MQKALSKFTFVEFLDTLLRDACREQTYSIDYIPKPHMAFSNHLPRVERVRKTKRVVYTLFNQPNVQPIAFNHCQQLLFDRDHNGLGDDGMTNETWDDDRCAVHASLIIGRRSVGRTCQFLVRTTFGETCKDDYDWECERGQLWIDEDRAADNALSFIWIPQWHIKR